MVLIVDDHADSANALKRLLEHRGLEAKCAFGARDAIEFLRHTKPDLIVLDDMMPDASGVDVLQQMRNDPELKGIKVVFYSAVFDYERKQQAERLGISDWMVKGTMKMSEIVDRIAAAVQLSS